MKKIFASVFLSFLILINYIPVSALTSSKNPFDAEDSLRQKIISSSSGKRKEQISTNKRFMGNTDRYIAVFNESASQKQIKKALSGYNYKLLADSSERIFLIYTENGSGFSETNKDILSSFEKDSIKDTFSYYPNDTYAKVYELEMLGMTEAWGYSLGNQNVIVAVVDSGIDRYHEDFAETSILPGFDYESGQSLVETDSTGHGTKVSGIIAATGNNGIGCVGIAPRCSLLPLKITNGEGKIYTSDFIDSLYLAADSGAKVINMSLGSYEKLESEEKAIKYALSKSCILVAASGNEGNHSDYAGMKCYPASYDGVISVGAVNESGQSCIFSQHNEAVDISAPGSGLSLLASGGGYTSDSGTSFSSAFVSGCAALALSVLDEGYGMTCDQFDYLISSTAKGEAGTRTGAGILSPAQILSHANFPLVSGVENGKVYYDNVVVHFNRGVATLDGDSFKSGELCKHTGEHTLIVTDGDKVTTVEFTTDNLPLSCVLKEGDGYSYISFSFGSATLNGHPYKSGTPITADGKHTLILTGLYGNSKTFEFDLSFSSPAINGVENGEIYKEPVRISVSTGGKIYLNGKETPKEFTVYEEGQHTLLIRQNGNKKKTVNFTISYEDENNPYKYKIIETSISNAKSASGLGVIAVWNGINRGLRLYDQSNGQLIRYVNVGENITGVYFGEKCLYVSGTNRLFTLNAEDIRGNVSLSSVFEFSFPVSATDFSEGILYFVESSSVKSGSIKKLELSSLSETEICFVRSIPDLISYDPSTSSIAFGRKDEKHIYVSPVEGGSISMLTPFETIETGFIFRNGKIACGGTVYSLSGVKNIFSVNDTSALHFDGETLITEKGTYSISNGEKITYHAMELSSVSFSSNLVCATFGEVSLFVSKMLPSAKSTGFKVSHGEDFGFTSHISLPKTFSFTALIGNRIYASTDENVLYILDSDTLECVSFLPLTFIPTGMKTAGKYLYLYSEKINEIWVYNPETSTTTIFNMPFGISDLTVSGDYVAFIAKGNLYLCNREGELLGSNESGEFVSLTLSHDGTNLYATENRSFYTVLTSLTLPDLTIEYERVLDYEADDIFCDSTYIYINTAAYLTRNGGNAASCSSKIYGRNSNVFVTAKGLFSDGKYISHYNATGDSFILKEKGELAVFSGTDVYVFKDPYYSEHLSPPEISGFENGESKTEKVTVSFSKGMGYLDGSPIESGYTVSSGGTHTLTVILPLGMEYVYTFRINASLSALRIKGGDTALKINDSKTFQAEFLPTGSPAEEIMFYSDKEEILHVTPSGKVTALKQGEAKLFAATIDGRIYTSIKITVLSSMLVFTPSYIGVDRSNGLVYGIPSGTTVDMLIGSLESELKENSVIYHGETVAEGNVKTGMKIALLSKKGEILDSLLISVTGDCNGDGNVDVGDLHAACELMNKEDAEPVFIKSADFSNTGTIDVADTFTYKEIILGNEKIVENAASPRPRFESEVGFDCYGEKDGTFSLVIYAKSKDIKGISGKISYDSEKFTFISAERAGYVSGVEEHGNSISFLAVFRNSPEVGGESGEKAELLKLTFLPSTSAGGAFTAKEIIVLTNETFHADSVTRLYSPKKEEILNSLVPSVGTLIPEFSSQVYSYVLRLPQDSTALTFSHEGIDEITIDMDEELKDGSIIEITAGDKTYMITVIREMPPVVDKHFPVWLTVVLSISAVTIILLIFFGKNIKQRFFHE